MLVACVPMSGPRRLPPGASGAPSDRIPNVAETTSRINETPIHPVLVRVNASTPPLRRADLIEPPAARTARWTAGMVHSSSGICPVPLPYEPPRGRDLPTMGGMPNEPSLPPGPRSGDEDFRSRFGVVVRHSEAFDSSHNPPRAVARLFC